MISVIIPVYNEAGTILATLSEVKSLAFVDHVFVVDDGSTDETTTILLEMKSDEKISIILRSTNRGKGYAIRSALGKVRSPYVIVQDADREYDPSEIRRLLTELNGHPNTAVYGSRRLGRARFLDNLRNPYYLCVSLLNFWVYLLYRVSVTDEATCYKLFSTSSLKRMELECVGFEFCPEVTAKAIRLGLTIREVPISYAPRTRQQGKKIRFKDAYVAFYTLWRYRNWQASKFLDDGVSQCKECQV